jgi:hypothetical protein
VLVELVAGKDIVAEVHQVDINVSAAGGIVGVAFGRSQSVIAEAEKIVVIDLIMQGGGSGPNQRAHAAIADGQAVVAARRGGVEREVGVRDQAGVVVFEQTPGGLGICGGQTRQRCDEYRRKQPKPTGMDISAEFHSLQFV